MRKRLLLSLAIILIFISPLFSQRILFSDIIPLRGHIDIEEKFELELNQQENFKFSTEIAGTTHDIASYSFISNSPLISYRLTLSPGVVTPLGEGIFAFRNTRVATSDRPNSPIPFKLSVTTETREMTVSDEEFRTVQKPIGSRVGSQLVENGIISVTFPTEKEGFDLQEFSSGAYEASIAVEVSAD
ncbi:MAG: hypothetical protein GX842_03610 [Spirochaetales bacterium]|jgi:hypothetical protein|nr:hypothetical protein [Spirochaetales bacterium]